MVFNNVEYCFTNHPILCPLIGTSHFNILHLLVFKRASCDYLVYFLPGEKYKISAFS